MASSKKKDARFIHQDLNSFVDFKREMVRLDFAASNLRKACQAVKDEKERQREELRCARSDVESRGKLMESQILQDAQATLELEKVARMKSEQRRLLENDVMAVRLKVEEMVRKQAKLKLAVASLEQHRVFLNDIISHKVSPRTPSSARRFFDSEGGVAEMVHSPKMIRERLAKKEMNVISQSELMLQATELVDRFPVNHRYLPRHWKYPKYLQNDRLIQNICLSWLADFSWYLSCGCKGKNMWQWKFEVNSLLVFILFRNYSVQLWCQ